MPEEGGGFCPLQWVQEAVKSGKCQPVEILPKLKGGIQVEAVTPAWVEVPENSSRSSDFSAGF